MSDEMEEFKANVSHLDEQERLAKILDLIKTYKHGIISLGELLERVEYLASK